MKNGCKKITAAILAAMLVLSAAGCGSRTVEGGENSAQASGTGADGSVGLTAQDMEGNGAAKGRYLEKEVSKPEPLSGNADLTLMSDGSVGILDLQNGIKSISADEGQTWSSEDLSEMQTLLQRGIEVGGALAPDGGIFYYYIDWDHSEEGKLYPEKYVYLAPDGSRNEFELGIEGYMASVMKAAFGSAGHLFVYTNSNKVHEIDLKTQTDRELFAPGSGWDLAFCADAEQLWVQDGAKVYRYSYESGGVSTEDAVLNRFIAEQTDKRAGTVICNASGEDMGEALYFACAGGIYRHVADGSVMEQLADGELNSLSDPTRSPVGMVQLQEGKFLILYGDGELLSYEYDAEASVVPEEQVAIYSLHDNETVRRAISVFRKQNPDVFVKFEIGLTGADGMTENDAIHSLNTRLLAGEGPDLLLLDGLPMDSYVNKGILEDLSGVAAELKSENHFFDHILEAYKQNKGTFVLPLRFELPLLSGAKSELDGITDLGTLAAAAERLADSGEVQQTVLGNYTSDEMLDRLYPLCVNAWLTEEGQLDAEALRRFLTDAKRIYDADQKNLTAEKKEKYKEIRLRSIEYFGEEDYQNRMKRFMMQVSELLYGERVLMAGYVSSVDDYENIISVNRTLDGHGISNWSGQSGPAFPVNGMAGLCANAKNRETAVSFLKAMFGNEVQQKDLKDGLPVNADAFDLLMKNPGDSDELYSTGGSDEDGNSISLTVYWPNAEEINELKNSIQNLTTPSCADDYIKNEVLSIGTKVLTGEKGIDESVNQIMQKVSIHLQE